MKPIDPAGFEALFRENPDPWDYAGSAFEAFKRDRLLRACGGRIHGRGFELACANGETTLRLATRCLRLLAVDASPTAVREATRRTRDLDHVVVREAVLPRDSPSGPFDLIVASEILYYLSLRDMMDLLARLKRSLAPGGRIVVLHHVLPFDDASQPPAIAQRRARDYLAAWMPIVAEARHERFEVFAARKPRQ